MTKKWKMDLLLKYKNPPKINSEGFIKETNSTHLKQVFTQAIPLQNQEVILRL